MGLKYCIVLYLSIYIAPLTVHTNQRRSQCERPREKKEVFRQRKEALGPPVNKQERVKGGSWFHSAGPMNAKARVLAIAVLARGTNVCMYVYMYVCMYVCMYLFIYLFVDVCVYLW